MWLFYLLPLCSVWEQRTANHSSTLDSDVFEYIKTPIPKKKHSS